MHVQRCVCVCMYVFLLLLHRLNACRTRGGEIGVDLSRRCCGGFGRSRRCLSKHLMHHLLSHPVHKVTVT